MQSAHVTTFGYWVTRVAHIIKMPLEFYIYAARFFVRMVNKFENELIRVMRKNVFVRIIFRTLAFMILFLLKIYARKHRLLEGENI